MRRSGSCARGFSSSGVKSVSYAEIPHRGGKFRVLSIRLPSWTNVRVALLRSDARARTARDHPRAPLPARPDLAQRRAAADGQAEGAAGPGRVLGLQPRQLPAHDALPEGLARALRGRRT